jgi:3-oxoacyl-[acyl-carrier-protein] synthase II
LSNSDPAGDGISFVANFARPWEMDYAIANGFGFGGVNASALFRRWTGNDLGIRNIASRQ